jgi:hypothetical protein
LDFPDDHYPGWEEDYQALADTPPQSSPVPGINDLEAIKKFKEEKPLEFTVRKSEDYVGGEEGTKASHLYFGGGNKKGAQHFFSDGRPAQAFITHNVKGGKFNVEEIQDETRPDGSMRSYSNQVITKLAQQTVLDWADSGLSTITFPKGEPIFDKYYTTPGKGLWGDEKSLLKVKGDKEFEEKAFAFYNQPILQEEINKDVRQHISLLKHLMNLGESIEEPLDGMRDSYGVEYGDMILEIVNKTDMTSPSYTEKNANHQDAVDILTLHRADKLKGLRSNYQGKVRHYNESFKAFQKALKQHGAELDIKETPEGWDVDLINDEETFRKVKTDGFTMAMNILKGIADRQVA